MTTFQFKDLMINMAAAGEKKARLCAGYTLYTCYDRTCQMTVIPMVTTTCAEYVALRNQLAGVPDVGALCFGFTPCAYPTVPHCAQGSRQALVPNICEVPTFWPCAAATWGGTPHLTPTIQVDPEGVASQLSAVKAQLQQELAAIEAQQQAVSESLRPQTVADVEELQSKLRDALSELDQRKQELQKPDKSGKK